MNSQRVRPAFLCPEFNSIGHCRAGLGSASHHVVHDLIRVHVESLDHPSVVDLDQAECDLGWALLIFGPGFVESRDRGARPNHGLDQGVSFSTFVIDERGIIRWRNLTSDYRVRPRPDDVLAQIHGNS